jgi:hypothetical protein
MTSFFLGVYKKRRGVGGTNLFDAKLLCCVVQKLALISHIFPVVVATCVWFTLATPPIKLGHGGGGIDEIPPLCGMGCGCARDDKRHHCKGSALEPIQEQVSKAFGVDAQRSARKLRNHIDHSNDGSCFDWLLHSLQLTTCIWVKFNTEIISWYANNCWMDETLQL